MTVTETRNPLVSIRHLYGIVAILGSALCIVDHTIGDCLSILRNNCPQFGSVQRANGTPVRLSDFKWFIIIPLRQSPRLVFVMLKALGMKQHFPNIFWLCRLATEPKGEVAI